MASSDELTLPEAVGNLIADDNDSNPAGDPWLVFDGLDLGLALWSEDGVLLRCNDPFAALFGKSEEACRPGVSL